MPEITLLADVSIKRFIAESKSDTHAQRERQRDRERGRQRERERWVQKQGSIFIGKKVQHQKDFERSG